MAVNMPVIAAVYLIVINLTAFAAMGIDKSKAKRGAWRIPEKTLFLLALIGGSVGAWGGMYCFRHKTKHVKFIIGMPVIVVLHLLAAGVIIYRF